ncbi:hypothetical protein QQ020_14595 [Fulvivirgaceae bacterium BMA12]|uniref:Lipoprotein n=1 Tax=Agaribacillus aureus TaxID=3051825 RepID=A0ABT8L6B5_9BACT|nr:hypothetical protein [Fulvivirgaceae bacterium BMA12]
MKKLTIALLSLAWPCLLFIASCASDEGGGGNCSISCGGFGTGQPFVQTNHPGTTESDCMKMGEEKGRSCKTSFCPPTGDPDDCYQVYP